MVYIVGDRNVTNTNYYNKLWGEKRLQVLHASLVQIQIFMLKSF